MFDKFNTKLHQKRSVSVELHADYKKAGNWTREPLP